MWERNIVASSSEPMAVVKRRRQRAVVIPPLAQAEGSSDRLYMEMEDIQLLAKIAAALSDPLRVQILDILVRGRDETCASIPHPQLPLAVCPYLDVQPKLGKIATSKLSYHFK